MHFCKNSENWLYEETVATVDSASRSSCQQKQLVRRRSSTPTTTTTSPPPPARIPVMELMTELQHYLLSKTDMMARGYPVEIETNSTKAMMYVNPPPRSRRPVTSMDVNAPEFVPSSQADSGVGSWGSSPRSDSDEEADAVDRVCVRCARNFRMTRDGEYIKEEYCFFHWGRMNFDNTYDCCKRSHGANGCTSHRYHVWNGTVPGMNGPLDGYVRARLPRGGVYALDCEMCYTTAGLELASIAVIATDGRIVYKETVKPSSPIIDCNTRFSGIRIRDLLTASKTLKEIQNDILGFVGTNTILIGHALENDLRALKLLHRAVVDTSDLYPHSRGLPLRRSLRALSVELLGRKVKERKSGGHSPVEDARAALDLVLVKVHEDRATKRFQPRQPPQPQPQLQRQPSTPALQPYDPLMSGA